MYAWWMNVVELPNEANYNVGTGDPYMDMSRLSLHTRRELKEAARVLNPGDINSTLVTQHSTVVTNAQTRSVNNIR
jgi:hypothetical protein